MPESAADEAREGDMDARPTPPENREAADAALERSDRLRRARIEASRDQPRRWSGLPIAASLALVAFAVVFGIYGPPVVDRGAPSVGTPTWELADEVVDRFEASFLQRHDGEIMSRADAAERLRELLPMAVDVPDLSAEGYEPAFVEPASLPAANRAAIVGYVSTQNDRLDYLGVAIVPDQEQYVVYSSFGRPKFLPAFELYPVETDLGQLFEPHASVWSNGSVVFVIAGTRGSPIANAANRVMHANTDPRVLEETTRALDEKGDSAGSSEK